MFQAFILPLDSSTGRVEINYDSMPSARRDVAKSLSHCEKALIDTKVELQKWGERSESNGGLEVQMSRPCVLVAVTPTRQEMASSLGREVSFFPFS